MSERKIYNLIIDEEFSRLIAPLSPSQYAELEQKIISHNYNPPITIWNRIIIKGLAEYEIYHKHKISFYVKEISFTSRCEAIINITSESIKRNDISDELYRYCVGKMYDAAKNKMELLYPHQNQYTPVSQRRPGYDNNRQTTSQLLGEQLHLSNGCVYKYGVYSRAIDTIFNKTPSIAQKILTGTFHVSLENTIELSKLSKEEITVIYEHVIIDNNNQLLYSIIQKNRLSEKERNKLIKKRKQKNEPEIKQMPLYDPDAEISSLTLTIPTWISSIHRTMTIANLNQATTNGLWKLEQQLNALNAAILELKKNIQEEYHD